LIRGTKQLKSILGFVLACWVIVGALITAAVTFYATLFFTHHPTPWNFPGDPPLFDLLIFAGAIAAVVNLPVALLVGRLRGHSSTLILLIPRLCAAVAVVMLLVSAAGILERHDARWAQIRNGIRLYGDRVAEAAGDKDRVLTEEEFKRFHDKFMPQPVAVRLTGYGTVHLRMAHGVFPMSVWISATGRTLCSIREPCSAPIRISRLVLG
jgi:hypothetical protein